jgi:hypothetical protein
MAEYGLCVSFIWQERCGGGLVFTAYIYFFSAENVEKRKDSESGFRFGRGLFVKKVGGVKFYNSIEVLFYSSYTIFPAIESMVKCIFWMALLLCSCPSWQGYSLIRPCSPAHTDKPIAFISRHRFRRRLCFLRHLESNAL